MWLRLLLLAMWGLIDGGLSELLADWQQIDSARSRPFVSLLLGLQSPSSIIGHPRVSSHDLGSSLRAVMSAATSEEVAKVLHRDMSGVIKNYFPEKKFGFVSCPQIMDEFGGDAFVMKSDLGKMKVGDEITFDVEDNDGRPKATNLRLVSKSNVDRNFKGVIKVYFPTKKYGFISCDQVTERFGRDAIVMKTDMGFMRIGDKVIFDLGDNDGRPQATNVRLAAKSDFSEKVQKHVEAMEVAKLDIPSTIDEVEKLTDSFTNMKASTYGEVLRQSWEMGPIDIFRASADASDLDTEQRALLVGEDGSFFDGVTRQCDVDFVWLDSDGKISIYGHLESSIRKAMEEILWQAAFLRQRKKEQQDQLEQQDEP